MPRAARAGAPDSLQMADRWHVCPHAGMLRRGPAATVTGSPGVIQRPPRLRTVMLQLHLLSKANIDSRAAENKSDHARSRHHPCRVTGFVGRRSGAEHRKGAVVVRSFSNESQATPVEVFPCAVTTFRLTVN
jgi:hypothetical protein